MGGIAKQLQADRDAGGFDCSEQMQADPRGAQGCSEGKQSGKQLRQGEVERKAFGQFFRKMDSCGKNGNHHGSAFPDDKSDCGELNRTGKSVSCRILPKKHDAADAEALFKNLTERRKKGFSDAVIIAVDTRMDTGGGKGEGGDF